MSKPLTQEDRNQWRRFLASESGLKGVSYLEQLKADVSEAPEAHNVILRAGIMQGYNKLLNQLRDLAVTPEKYEPDEEQTTLDPVRSR